jgi:alpha-glucosidase
VFSITVNSEAPFSITPGRGPDFRNSHTIREPMPLQTAAGDVLRAHHDGSGRYVRPMGSVGTSGLRIGDGVAVRLRTSAGSAVERVLVRTVPDGEQAFTEMHRVGEGAAWIWWEAPLELREPVVGYRFLIVTPAGIRWLNGTGLHDATPVDAFDFRLLAGYEAPGWLEGAIVYQIFPDRFAPGGREASRATIRSQVERVQALGLPGAARAWDEPASHGREALFEFYGGDLDGIVSKLDHLQALGVTAIYLNPIFDSVSNHGYDCVDYDHVAERLGGDAALARLRAATAERGMRLILDIAPNHLGARHPWFLAAQADATAPTAEYFAFLDHPHEYESWLGHRSLVKLDYRSAALKEAMYAGPDGAVRRWLRDPYAIDGWRIDVANMLGRLGPSQLNGDVARGIRAAAREENPEAVLIGENWFDATAQLMGDQWDAAMNYAGFTTPLLDWLAGVKLEGFGSAGTITAGRTSTTALADTLAQFRAAVPWTMARQQLLLVGSHDTARIATVLGGNSGLLRLAFGMLLTYPGVPCVFYGDEIGLEGGDSLSARRTMPWAGEGWDWQLLAFVRLMAGHRRRLPALVSGGFQVLGVEEDCLAYARETEEDVAVVLANRGPGVRPAGQLDLAHADISDEVEMIDLVSGAMAQVQQGRLRVPEMPPGIAVWYGHRGGDP